MEILLILDIILLIKKNLLDKILKIKKKFSRTKIFPKLIKKERMLICSMINLLDIGIKKDLINSSKFIENKSKRKFAILDRDGVINYDYGYVHKKKILN